MRIIEQVCTKCRAKLSPEVEVCPQCKTLVVKYEFGEAYQWATSDSEIDKMLAKIPNAQFIGKSDQGYWIVGPVEKERWA